LNFQNHKKNLKGYNLLYKCIFLSENGFALWHKIFNKIFVVK